MLRITSISILAALAVSGQAALAQSDDGSSFCEAGYSPTDANADGMVSPEELRNASELEFSDLDANNDGMVSQEEYLDCRTNWAVSAEVTETLSEEDVTVLDQNADGKVDQGEFMDAADQEYMARWSETGTEKEVRDSELAPDAELQDEAEATQDEIDKATGGATPGEPQAVILRRVLILPGDNQKAIEDMGRDEIAQRSSQTFLLLDTDSNKAIEPEEETAEASGDLSAEERENIMRAILHQTFNQQFDRIDADQSGDVSPEEYAADAEKRWNAAKQRAESEEMDTEGGAPVVIFRYPHPM